MSLTAQAEHAWTLSISPERITTILLWLAVFAGSFVLFEPTPYEALFVVLAYAVYISRTPIPSLLALPLGLIAIWITGGLLSVAVNASETRAITYIAISTFMGLTTIVIAILLAENPQKNIQTIRSAYIATALLSALAAIIGYLNLLPGSEIFVLLGRAKAMFKDPNVFAPFLILPALLLFQDILYSSFRKLIIPGAMLTILLVALLFGFSRASWGHLLFSGLVMTSLMFAASGSNIMRFRIIGFGIFCICLGGAVIAAVLSIPDIAEVFLMRFSLEQSYDVGETGRFGTQLTSLPYLLEAPFGFGPHKYSTMFHQDPHDVYINGFASYGWLGGFAYIAFVLSTWFVGIRYALFHTPWQDFHSAAFATFLGLSLEGFVIDTDHWRHFFLLAGLVWGLSAATIKYRNNNQDYLRARI